MALSPHYWQQKHRSCLSRSPIQHGRRCRVAARMQISSSRCLGPVASSNTEVVPPRSIASVARLIFNDFLQRYRGTLLTSGIGSVAVTTWCLSCGNSPVTATAVAGAATVMALAIDEVLNYNDGRRQPAQQQGRDAQQHTPVTELMQDVELPQPTQQPPVAQPQQDAHVE